ncbi:hypothetical protein PMG71_05100 [Roseofilum sp. BLCC_M154]|uniref:Lasso RiPP family leader peptide-containing protein n=1 Tax=Roseofilum acuticapitatum BLCC-M154 TaxID=3022444 RepID=A0ABT7APH2_9CYAN|nr:hypothetical protein [Roseofilum acuticapitatum]MDJ1168795.1 hypothetical protein [Roseofilum acuticapitatum BLCC-M154]
MSATDSNQANLANNRPYHTPKLKKFGSVSDLTLTSPFAGNSSFDGGAFPNSYVAAGS